MLKFGLSGSTPPSNIETEKVAFHYDERILFHWT